jgi:hypothetical protein
VPLPDRREVVLPPAVADLAGVKPSSLSFTTTFMLDKSVPEVELLRAGYAAFNARDADATLATMTSDVILPNGMKGDYIQGHQAIRAYWKRQWSIIHPHDEPISFHREDSRCILVDVHQVVRDLAGTVLADRYLGHCCIIEHGLIQAIEVLFTSIIRPLSLTSQLHRNESKLSLQCTGFLCPVIGTIIAIYLKIM